MVETLTEIYHPQDPVYALRRQKQINELMKLTPQQLRRQLDYLKDQMPPRDEHEYSKKMLGELFNSPMVPRQLRKGILDSTSGTTGNVLIRQDLEPTIYALFVKYFPAFERLQRLPANGLVHAATQITAPDPNALGSSVVTELGTVNYASSDYQRATYPIAVFAQGRGVSIKELAAVQAGGAPYEPMQIEMADAIVRLSTDIQYFMMQGNASNSSGTANTEAGNYNQNGFDGFRGVLGAVGAFAGNNAIQQDEASLNLLESLQSVAAKDANNGGMPSAVFMSMNAKQALDIEQQNNRRYNDDTVEIIPGVRVTQIPFANGNLAVIPVPGNTIGTYNRSSDGQLVEDLYVIDESATKLRWLYSDSFTVLQIPSGVDGQLSERYIIFAMFGLEIAAPLFCGKVRRLAS